MTLDEAIKHCEERAEQDCSACASEHKQLAEWLRELRMYRELVKEIEYASEVVDHKDRGIDLYYDGFEDGVNRIYDYLYALRRDYNEK